MKVVARTVRQCADPAHFRGRATRALALPFGNLQTVQCLAAYAVDGSRGVLLLDVSLAQSLALATQESDRIPKASATVGVAAPTAQRGCVSYPLISGLTSSNAGGHPPLHQIKKRVARMRMPCRLLLLPANLGEHYVLVAGDVSARVVTVYDSLGPVRHTALAEVRERHRVCLAHVPVDSS